MSEAVGEGRRAGRAVLHQLLRGAVRGAARQGRGPRSRTLVLGTRIKKLVFDVAILFSSILRSLQVLLYTF